MDKVIKEGTLRVLISESTCDVILSCNGHRLMAHKLILSIASPVFRELLEKNYTDATTVIILPDISGSIMSTILDYIYTGTTMVYTHSVQEFLSAAIFLQIAVDATSLEDNIGNLQKVDFKKVDVVRCGKRKCDVSDHDRHVENIEYCKMDVKKQDVDNTSLKTMEESTVVKESKVFQTKLQRKMPDLLPIGCKAFRKLTQKKMCNAVVPSPWCQRNDLFFLGDPRDVAMVSPENEIISGKANLYNTDELLNTLFCNCKNGCGARCGCRKSGLQCTLACGQCNGHACLNAASSQSDPEKESVFQPEMLDLETTIQDNDDDDDNETETLKCPKDDEDEKEEEEEN